MSATAGAGATAGASAMGGSGGMPGGAGAGTAGSPPSAGTGGAAAGAAGAGTAGSAGSGAAAGAGGSGHGGMGGSGGSSGGAGGMGGSGGAADCAGHAVSLSANAAGDSAKARVEIDLMNDLPIGNTSRTVEVWAYMKTADWSGNVNTLFFYGAADPRNTVPGFGLDFGNTSGGIGSIDPFANNEAFDNDNQASGVMVAMNQWVHFAMTWDGTAMKAFVNGVQKSSKSSSAAPTTIMTVKSVFTLGGYPAENAYFPDYVDELRIWNVARSASDILASMNKGLVGNEAGLVGYWKFNESSGTTAMDSVTTAGHTAHNGTLMAAMPANVPTFVVPTPPSPVMCP
jgi:hypothetical protein